MGMAIVVVALVLTALNLAVVWVWLPLVDYDGWVKVSPDYEDALHTAVEIGRLDAISLLLAVLGILLGIMALVGFGYVRYRAEAIAKETADKVAKEVVLRYGKSGGGLEDSGRQTTPTPSIDAGQVDLSQLVPEGRNDGHA